MRHCRQRLARSGKRLSVFQCSTGLVQRRCYTCGCRITKATLSMAVAENCCRDIKLSSLIPKNSRRQPAWKGISGCAGRAPRLSIGDDRKLRPVLLLTVGCARATSIGKTRTAIGFTWAVRTIASNRAASGSRRSKLKEHYSDTKALAGRQWLKILMRPDCRARVRLWCERTKRATILISSRR